MAGAAGHGDALLLYTDGMVETATRDIGLGIDRMLGQAERLLRGRFEGGAARLVDALGSHQRRPGTGPRPPALTSAAGRLGCGRDAGVWQHGTRDLLRADVAQW